MYTMKCEYKNLFLMLFYPVQWQRCCRRIQYHLKTNVTCDLMFTEAIEYIRAYSLSHETRNFHNIRCI